LPNGTAHEQAEEDQGEPVFIADAAHTILLGNVVTASVDKSPSHHRAQHRRLRPAKLAP
jgi:hypothetical protein